MQIRSDFRYDAWVIYKLTGVSYAYFLKTTAISVLVGSLALTGTATASAESPGGNTDTRTVTNRIAKRFGNKITVDRNRKADFPISDLLKYPMVVAVNGENVSYNEDKLILDPKVSQATALISVTVPSILGEPESKIELLLVRPKPPPPRQNRKPQNLPLMGSKIKLYALASINS